MGSQIARVLLREGAEVSALVRPGSDLRRIETIAGDLRLVEADLRDRDQLAHCVRRIRPELCIHAAWHAVPGDYLHSTENLDLLAASLCLASELADVGCGRLVGIGTCFEYDTSLGTLSEESPTRPDSIYAASKLSLWLLLQQLGRRTGMSTAWARLFYLYGPHEDERRLVPSVIRSLLKGEEARLTAGEQVRDVLHVEDVAEGVCAIARTDLEGVVNVASGDPLTVRELAERAGEIIGRAELISFGAVPYAPGDPMVVRAVNHRLAHECGWQRRFSLEEGLRDTVGWWRNSLGLALVDGTSP